MDAVKTVHPGLLKKASDVAPASHKSAERINKRISNFIEAEAKRPEFGELNSPIEVSKSPNPTWDYGQGVHRSLEDASTAHVEINPSASDRPMWKNYRLLLSGIVPRPIGFISTVSGDGKTKNLAPFSYFQVINHNPPMFIAAFPSRPGEINDTFRNLKETGECVINTVSEDMIEAVHASSIEAPSGVSEWDITGLHEAPTTTVKAPRVQESIFSIEGKVIDIKEFTDYAQPGLSIASMVLIEASRFWVREDAVDKELINIDLEKLRPIGQLGGMSYAKISSTFELPRRTWRDETAKSELLMQLEESSKAIPGGDIELFDDTFIEYLYPVQ